MTPSPMVARQHDTPEAAMPRDGESPSWERVGTGPARSLPSSLAIRLRPVPGSLRLEVGPRVLTVHNPWIWLPGEMIRVEVTAEDLPRGETRTVLTEAATGRRLTALETIDALGDGPEGRK